jgi:hypothetical protein
VGAAISSLMMPCYAPVFAAFASCSSEFSPCFFLLSEVAFFNDYYVKSTSWRTWPPSKISWNRELLETFCGVDGRYQEQRVRQSEHRAEADPCDKRRIGHDASDTGQVSPQHRDYLRQNH